MKYKISAEKWFGGMARILHRPEAPLFSPEECAKEVERLFNIKYSVYTFNLSKNEILIYRSQIPNERRGRLPGNTKKRKSILKNNQLPKNRTQLYFDTLKKAGVAVHFS